MDCSLTKAYSLIAAAIAALGAAAAAAFVFFNVPGLVAAIALVAGVAFGLIPAIRAELEAYEQCRGPSDRCRMSSNIDLLGQAAGFVGILSFTIALASQSAAILALVSFFGAWAAPALIAAGEVAKWSGIASCMAGAGILVGLAAQLASYQSCRDEEDRGRPPVGSSAAGLQSDAGPDHVPRRGITRDRRG